MIMKSNYFLCLFLLLNFAGACARFRPLSPSIDVTTDKQAKVSLWDEKTEKAQELGTTPFQSSYKELFEKSGDHEWISLIVSAPGYVSENIIVPRSQTSALNIKMKLQPIEWWNDTSRAQPSHVINQMGKNLQRIYIIIRQGKLEEAQTIVERLIAEYPLAPFLLDLKGSIQVLKGQKNEAISSYERSLQISSDNPETINILNDLKNEGSRQ